MTEIPHFRTPFQFIAGVPAEVEQDSIDERAQCVETVLLTEPGTRLENADFGTPPMVLTEAPLDVELIANAVHRWEPRVNALITETGDTWDELVRHVSVRVGGNDG